MAQGTTMARGQAPNGDTREKNDAPEGNVGLVPFVRASDEHIANGNVDKAQQMDASAHDLGVFNLPAYGHLAWMYVKVTATDGAAGTNNAVLQEDGPFNVLQQLSLTEPNGAYIVQLNSGYQLYLANKYGGYLPAISADPKSNPVYTDGGNDGNFEFVLRVPVQVSARDAVGSLPNQDSAGQFKFQATIAAGGTVFSTQPDTLPSVRIQSWIVAWDQPEPQTSGMSNQTAPPASGTTSFWSVQSGISVANGENNIELKRKGNYLRTIILVLRTSGSRATAESDWPSGETKFLRDAFPARHYDNDVWRTIMYERSGFTGTNDTAGALDNGVRVHDYMHEFDGEYGREMRDLWQPSRGSTRLEFAGNFDATSVLEVITNDVAIADNVFVG